MFDTTVPGIVSPDQRNNKLHEFSVQPNASVKQETEQLNTCKKSKRYSVAKDVIVRVTEVAPEGAIIPAIVSELA